MKLNNEQVKAVKTIAKPLLVLAGAGSGKTRVIIEKIKYLIRDCRYNPKTIYAVTFTNKAAREMQERVNKSLNKSESRGIQILTFHTLGLSILKKHGYLLGIKPKFSIYDQYDSLQLMTDLLGQDTDSAKIYLAQISAWKNDHILPNDAINYAKDELSQDAVSIYQEYMAHLETYNAVDFDDLIFKPLLILKEFPEALSYWRKTIQYLLVDEYQDTNLCQYELLKILMQNKASFTVVGDDDQSIYAWRGARPENLVELHKDFPNLELIKLEQNYRSTGNILSAANEVIKMNPHIYEKALWSELGMGNLITVEELKHGQDELDYVAFSIREKAAFVDNDYRNFAILYRGNHQAKAFELALNMKNIPVKIVGGTSFFQQQEIKELLAYLKVIVNREDNASLLRIINVPKREIGAVTLKKVVEFAKEHKGTIFDSLNHPYLGSVIGQKSAFRCQKFAQMIENCREIFTDKGIEEGFDYLIEASGFDEYLRTESSTIKAYERKNKNLYFLKEWLKRYDGTLEEILAQLTLISILENESDEKSPNAVTLMTLHSAKGLEFPYVYLVGLEEDILPHKNSIDRDTIDEERRLFYVGMTRAKEHLTITYCRQRKKFGEWESCTPSRFLRELPKENINWKKVNDERNEKEEKDSLSSTLSELKGLLSGISEKK